jgi:hypothetical protein
MLEQRVLRKMLSDQRGRKEREGEYISVIRSFISNVLLNVHHSASIRDVSVMFM